MLAFIAHPDDEIFVSGTLCLCADTGLTVGIVCATAGERGAQELLSPLTDACLADVRRQELFLSAKALGVRYVEVLEYPDLQDPSQGSGHWDTQSLSADIEALIRRHRPELILTHGAGGGYGHAGHRMLYRCVMAAVASAEFTGSVFSFCARVGGAFFSWHFDEASHVLIDVRRYLKRRVASLSYHQSQAEFFLQPYFPETPRKLCSALFGYALAFTETGRRRIPIGTATRFMRRLPVEGLRLQQGPADGPHFFSRRYAGDPRIRITS